LVIYLATSSFSPLIKAESIGQVTDYLNADDDIGQKYILDVGCGTGRWYVSSSSLSTRDILMKRAYEVAQAFPAVNVRNPSSKPDK